MPLGQVASVRAAPQLSVIQRYNQARAVSVQAKHPQLTAQGIADRVGPVLAEIRASGVQVELGGEIEENASANEAIAARLSPATRFLICDFTCMECLLKNRFVECMTPSTKVFEVRHRSHAQHLPRCIINRGV